MNIEVRSNNRSTLLEYPANQRAGPLHVAPATGECSRGRVHFPFIRRLSRRTRLTLILASLFEHTVEHQPSSHAVHRSMGTTVLIASSNAGKNSRQEQKAPSCPIAMANKLSAQVEKFAIDAAQDLDKLFGDGPCGRRERKREPGRSSTRRRGPAQARRPDRSAALVSSRGTRSRIARQRRGPKASAEHAFALPLLRI